MLFSVLMLILAACGTSMPSDTNDESLVKDGIYTNAVDGYTLEIPETWENYTVVEASRSTEFLYKSDNPELHQSLFRVFVMDVAEWEETKKEEPLIIQEILVTDDTAYLYVTPLDVILEGDELAEFQNMFAVVPSVIASFKLVE